LCPNVLYILYYILADIQHNGDIWLENCKYSNHGAFG